jgi:DNA-binding NarL/FixJ family response regulator
LIKSPARVLVADDHEQMRSLIAELLSEGFQVVGAVADGEELVRAAGSLRPDIIISDIAMPRMSGLEARNKLIRQKLAIPFVFVSAIGKEVAQLVPTDSRVALVYKAELADHLISAVEAVLAGAGYRSPYYRG